MIAQYIREQGKLQEGTDMLVRLLEARFSGIPKWAMKKIQLASLPEIEKWSLRLLDAKNIEEVFNT